MTEEQYKQYDQKVKQLAPIKDFLKWCGNKYRGKGLSKYFFSLKAIRRNFSLERKCEIAKENTYTIPYELQQRIVKTIEDYVDEKEKDLEQI